MAQAPLPAGIEPEWVTVPQTETVSNLGKTKIFELIRTGEARQHQGWQETPDPAALNSRPRPGGLKSSCPW